MLLWRLPQPPLNLVSFFSFFMVHNSINHFSLPPLALFIPIQNQDETTPLIPTNQPTSIEVAHIGMNEHTHQGKSSIFFIILNQINILM